MKPQWIFTAVGTIAILMFLVLPRAIQASPATDASTGVLVMNQNHVSADQPTAEANPTLVDQPAADVQPEAIDQSPPIEQPAVAELPMVEPTTHPHAAAAGIPQRQPLQL